MYQALLLLQPCSHSCSMLRNQKLYKPAAPSYGRWDRCFFGLSECSITHLPFSENWISHIEIGYHIMICLPFCFSCPRPRSIYLQEWLYTRWFAPLKQRSPFLKSVRYVLLYKRNNTVIMKLYMKNFHYVLTRLLLYCNLPSVWQHILDIFL